MTQQTESDWALAHAQDKVRNGTATAIHRTLLALAAENKALEERVRRLRIAIREDLFTDEALHNDDLLAADDAKAAGEPPVVEPKVRCSAVEAGGRCIFDHGHAGMHCDQFNQDWGEPAAKADNRASRRRAYVRGAQAAVCEGERFYKDWLARLIFDETESE